jgi:uncharacterized protein
VKCEAIFAKQKLFHGVNPLEIFHATHYCLSPKICIFNIFSELSVVCAHAHAGHTHFVNAKAGAVVRQLRILASPFMSFGQERSPKSASALTIYRYHTIVFFTSYRFTTKTLFTYIWSMKTSKTKILNQIKRIVKDKEPSAKIYLYGSRSRGTAKDNSDWDLLILLNKDDISNEVEREISYPLYDLEFDTGEVISPMIYSEKEWNSKYKVTPFYQNVMREGILL